MTDRNDRKSLTAAELIAELAQIPGGTRVTYLDRDSEWGITYYRAISGVSVDGVLRYGGILKSEAYDG